MKNICKLFILIILCISIWQLPVKAKSKYETALEKARNDGNSCIYTDGANNVYGYTVSSGVNYKFYLLGGVDSSLAFGEGSVTTSGYNTSKSNCRPFVSACLNDSKMKFVYENIKGTAATNCKNGKTVLTLDSPYNTQDGGITNATSNYKCVYRDNNDTIAATNLESSLGLTSVKILRYNGTLSNETLSVSSSNTASCPSYFLYAKQSDSGSFGGTGNTTVYSQFGSDFNELCSIAKKNDNISYEVLTRNDLPIPGACSKKFGSSSGGSIDGGYHFDSDYGYSGMDCSGLLGSPDDANNPAYWLQMALEIMRYAAIFALVGLSTADFIKAIASQDQDALKKAVQTTIKRFIYAVMIFFIPILVEIIMNFFGVYGTCSL